MNRICGAITTFGAKMAQYLRAQATHIISGSTETIEKLLK
jgi:hypothetical protein